MQLNDIFCIIQGDWETTFQQRFFKSPFIKGQHTPIQLQKSATVDIKHNLSNQQKMLPFSLEIIIFLNYFHIERQIIVHNILCNYLLLFYARLTERVTDYEHKIPIASQYRYIRQIQTVGNLGSMCNVCKLKPRSCKIEMARLSSFYHKV